MTKETKIKMLTVKMKIQITLMMNQLMYKISKMPKKIQIRLHYKSICKTKTNFRSQILSKRKMVLNKNKVLFK